jgi:hypothetical protein
MFFGVSQPNTIDALFFGDNLVVVIGYQCFM